MVCSVQRSVRRENKDLLVLASFAGSTSKLMARSGWDGDSLEGSASAILGFSLMLEVERHI